MLPNKKSEDVLYQILRALKDGNQIEVKQGLNRVLSNQDSRVQRQLGAQNLELSIKQLKLELQSEDNMMRMNETQRIQLSKLGTTFNGWIEMLCNLHIYYVERETAGGKVEEQFQKFFESCKCLIFDTNTFSFIHRQVVKEYQKIIKSMRKHAKDSQAVQRASHATKTLEAVCLQIFQMFAREINVKNLMELKLVNSNQHMKIYFLNFKFDRAKGCDKVEKEKQLLEYSHKSDIITYNYYKGRILIFQSEFSQASIHLQQVVNMCPNTGKGYKCVRQVLKYLIPVNLFLGKHPTKELIEYYKLSEYSEICDAVRQGNIKYLQQNIDKYRTLWIKRSLLILMDQLKVLCYRNLCKKVYLINEKKRKVMLELFLKAFELSHNDNSPPSIPEVCCIVANLIYLELIQGKIYQDSTKNVNALTLSENPFKFKLPEQINWQI